MAGLLGDMSDPQGMANLALAAGLLSPGSFGQGLGRGLQGYQGTLANAQDMQLKQQQILSAQQEQQVRDLAIKRTMMQLQDAAQWNQPQGGAAPAMPAGASAPSFMPGSGALPPAQNAANMAAANAPASAAPSGLPPGVAGYQGMPLEQLRSRINIGLEPKEAVELWKAANIGTPMPPGWRLLGNKREYLGDPNQPNTYAANGDVITQPGLIKAKTDQLTATTTAEGEAKNASTLLTPEQINSFGPQWAGKTVADLMNANRTQSVPGLEQFSPTGRAAIVADMKRNGIAQGTANGVPITATGAPASNGFKTTAQLAADKAAAEAAVKLATQPAIDSATGVASGDAKNATDYKSSLHNAVRQEYSLVQRNQNLLPLLQQFPTGGFGAESRAKIGNELANTQSLPADLRAKLGAWVAGGDPAAGRIIANQLAAAGISNLLQTLPEKDKPNRAEFMQLQQAAEGLESGKTTLEGVFALQKQIYDQHFAEQQALTQAVKNKTYDPSTWEGDYSKVRNDRLSAASAPAPAPAPTTFKMLPAASQYTGKRMKSDDGTIYRSDGKTWTKE